MQKTFTLDELHKISHEIVAFITKQKNNLSSTVLCLHGDLGAGKTTLVQHIAKHLGVSQHMQSPTFTILKNYPCQENSTWKNLIHIDAYRINHDSELQRLSWDNYVQNPNNLICIEWSENVPGLIPESAIHIYLNHADQNNRTITLK